MEGYKVLNHEQKLDKIVKYDIIKVRRIRNSVWFGERPNATD